MRIVLATPLYPPDIASPASYIKELAKRLAGKHEVVIVAYAHIPEEVPGVHIIAVDKRRPLPVRLVAFVFALAKAARSADAIFAENGASVELPAGIVARFARAPLILHESDAAARQYAASHWLYGFIGRFARNAARAAFADTPLPKPEILPLEARPEVELAAYEESWRAHLAHVESLLASVSERRNSRHA